MNKIKSIVWFRQDLRLSDNVALSEASRLGDILPIYIFDDLAPEGFKIGSASKLWLHHSLSSLNNSMDNKLNLYQGDSEKIIKNLIKKYNIENVFCNTCYEPWNLDQDEKIEEFCIKNSINFKSFNSNYLWHPNDTLKDDGSYYKVFTPYKNKSKLKNPRELVFNEKNIIFVKDKENKVELSDLNLLPRERWYEDLEKMWDFGEVAAQKKLDLFIKNGLNGYKDDRNYPIKKNVSMLSPHLHFGEISSVQIWHEITKKGHLFAPERDIEHFISEIIWREFSCYLMFHFKNLHKDNFNNKFDNFGWSRDQKLFDAWKKGQTGYPFIDAGMRELWQTGYMHNRPRLAVASFLIKNLNIHWHLGRDWFWDCLLDADLGNNSASWQWIAGCGADAAPYFRIFNPNLQGEKFDGDGEYIRKFVPELKNLPNEYLFQPWGAPSAVLKSAGIILGETYPRPIVDFVSSRDRALEIYKSL